MQDKRFQISILVLSLILVACASQDQRPNRAIASPTATAIREATAEPEPSPVSTVVMPSGGQALPSSDDGLDLVFSGGGAKGIAHIGALMELEKRGLAYRRLVGTSSGSIMALMLASGYSADEMLGAITERTADGQIIMAKFLDTPDSFPEEVVQDSFLYTAVDNMILSLLPEPLGDQARTHFVEELVRSPVIREFFSFTEFGGVYAGDVFLEFLREKLDHNGDKLSDLTLAEFHQKTGSDLTAIVTDITDHRMLIVNHRTAPDLPVTMLIRMSMSVPLVYNNVSWQPQWGRYLGEDISGHEMTDGGIGSNFGIEMVVSDDVQFTEAMGMEPERKRVIGFYLDDSLPVPGAEQAAAQTELNPDPLREGWQKVTDRNIDLFYSVLRSHDQFIVRTHPDVVCHLPAGGFGMLEFDMSDQRIALLLNAGQQAMAECLDGMGIE